MYLYQDPCRSYESLPRVCSSRKFVHACKYTKNIYSGRVHVREIMAWHYFDMYHFLFDVQTCALYLISQRRLQSYVNNVRESFKSNQYLRPQRTREVRP